MMNCFRVSAVVILFIGFYPVLLMSQNPVKVDGVIYDSLTGSKSFKRKVSMDKWEKTPYSFSSGFWLTVAF